jgi:hypothetical protein
MTRPQDSASRPDLENLTAAEMQARCISALDQAAATRLETEVAIRFWNERVRKPDEAEIPIPPRPEWLVDLLEGLDA